MPDGINYDFLCSEGCGYEMGAKDAREENGYNGADVGEDGKPYADETEWSKGYRKGWIAAGGK